jgi:hypothetical protein
MAEQQNTTPADDAVNDAENEMQQRKKKGTAGPKQRFWICFAMKKDKAVSEMMPWPTPEYTDDGEISKTFQPRPNDESEAAVRKEFKKKHRIDPLAVVGPIYEVKNKPAEKPRMGITVSARDLMRTTTKAFEGHYKGWTVFGNGLKALEIEGRKYGENELIRPVIETLVDPNSDPKPPKPRLKPTEALRLSDLDNVKELSD